MTIIKLRGKVISANRIEETIFIGEEGMTLQNAGKLILHTGEWQLFGALLGLGAEVANRNYPRAKVIFDHDEDIIKDLQRFEDALYGE
jgi:hypothetical protein